MGRGVLNLEDNEEEERDVEELECDDAARLGGGGVEKAEAEDQASGQIFGENAARGAEDVAVEAEGGRDEDGTDCEGERESEIEELEEGRVAEGRRTGRADGKTERERAALEKGESGATWEEREADKDQGNEEGESGVQGREEVESESDSEPGLGGTVQVEEEISEELG